MVSPQTGLAGGRTDLRPVATELDRLLCDDATLATLPGRFLFVLDDGRGDLVDRTCDLGLVALDDDDGPAARRRRTGVPSYPSTTRPTELLELARRFLVVRGAGADAPWHVDELRRAVGPRPSTRIHGRRSAAHPLPYGTVEGGTHVAVPDGVLDPAELQRLAPHAELVVTPWHGVLVPDGEEDQ